MAEVRIQDGESIENALRRFKRKVQQEDIIKEVKKHSFYLKPGEKKRIKQALARKRSRKKVRREPVEKKFAANLWSKKFSHKEAHKTQETNRKIGVLCAFLWPVLFSGAELPADCL
ncbi:MAG: 30S ribosomal protein S21 [Acidobacteria bacterium]|nr:MAG: 30S ribosomal protein S21 [Acidobacteriota bacterium]